MSRQTAVRTVKGNSLVTSSRFYSASFVEKVTTLLLFVLLFSLARLKLTMAVGHAHELRAQPFMDGQDWAQSPSLGHRTVWFSEGVGGKIAFTIPGAESKRYLFPGRPPPAKIITGPRPQLASPLGGSDSRPWVASTG